MTTYVGDYKEGDILYWRHMLFLVVKIKYNAGEYIIDFINITKGKTQTGYYREQDLEFEIL